MKKAAKDKLYCHEYVFTWHVEFSRYLKYSKTTTLFRFCLLDPPVISSPPRWQKNILFDVISWNGKQSDVSAYSNNFHVLLSTFLSAHFEMFFVEFDTIWWHNEMRLTNVLLIIVKITYKSLHFSKETSKHTFITLIFHVKKEFARWQ